MVDSARTLISALEAFTPAEASDSVARLYEILDGFDDLPSREAVLPAMFGILERYPDADLGSPGPLVHAIESVPNYESALAASLSRRPTFLSVWMIGRILNSSISVGERASWLERLREASIHPGTIEPLRANIGQSLSKHTQRGGA